MRRSANHLLLQLGMVYKAGQQKHSSLVRHQSENESSNEAGGKGESPQKASLKVSEAH